MLLTKPSNLVALFILFSVNVSAKPVFPIDPQEYGMQKHFGPPAPITPKNVLTTRPENQFDHSNREDYPSVVNSINNRMDRPFHLTFGQYDNSSYGGLLWRQREANYYVIGNLDYTNADSYDDGDGNVVNYGYDRQNGALILGLLPNMMTEHRLTFVYDDISDDKQPQHMMDPIDTRRMIGKYNLRIGAPDDSNTAHISLSVIDVERDANNFDLRRNPMGSPQIMMNVERQKYSVDVHFNHRFDEYNQSSFGISFIDDTHDAKRYRVTPSANMQNGYRFPDVHSQSTAIYASHKWQLDKKHKIKGALNYQWQRADVRGANVSFAGGMTSNRLWQMYYGRQVDGDINHHGLSGKLRYSFIPSNNQEFYAEVASLYRMPENPERFAVLPAPPGSGRGWGSNPWLEPERENRLTLGIEFNGAGWGGYQKTKLDDYASAWQLSAEVNYADVDDFITLDRYRRALPPLRRNIISTNVDAKLAGINISFKNNWTQNLSTALTASYQYGQNKTDNRPLYQISPFMANLSIDWKDYFDSGSYNIGSSLRYQAQQHRRDDNINSGLGIDRATGSFAVLDIYGGIEWKNTYGISFGVDNIFDREYAEFISGDHVEAVAPNIVNAPGRTYWLHFTAAF